MKKIEIPFRSSLETAVNLLLDYKAKGEQVYAIFNGHELYSDTVTMDLAYQEVHGCTKQEYDSGLTSEILLQYDQIFKMEHDMFEKTEVTSDKHIK